MVLKYQDSWWLSNKNKWSSSRLLQSWKKICFPRWKIQECNNFHLSQIHWILYPFHISRGGQVILPLWRMVSQKNLKEESFYRLFSLSRVCHSDIKRWCHPSCLNDDLERKLLCIYFNVLNCLFSTVDINLESFWSIYHHINIRFLVIAKCSS